MIRILLVDDNRAMVRALATAIPWKENGVEVCGYAYDGEEAKELLSDRIDVLVTDVKMPRMDGIELTRYATQRFPRLQVIFMSAYSEFEYAVAGLKLNVFDYISKPVDNKKLMEAVLSAHSHSSMQAEMEALLTDSLPYMRERVVMQLLLGDIRKQIKQLHRILPDWQENMWFTCMVFDLFQKGADIGIWEIKALVERDMPDMLCVIMSDSLLAVVSADACEPDQVRTGEWLRAANRILDLQKQCGRDVTVGVSQSLEGYLALPTLYQQAVRALNMRFLLGRDEVYVYPGVTESVCQEEQAVADAIACGEGLFYSVEEGRLREQLEELRRTLDRLEERELFVAAACSVLGLYARELFRGIMDVDISTAGKRCMETYARLIEGTKREGMEALCGLFREFRDMRFSRMNRENSHIIQRIFEASEKVGFEEDGGLERIAREVYLSPSYVSMLFKQETGKSISQHLTGLRLERARQLLRDPELKIYEISQMVGYPNQYYFSVWFKKNTGMTPSEYRNGG